MPRSRFKSAVSVSVAASNAVHPALPPPFRCVSSAAAPGALAGAVDRDFDASDDYNERVRKPRGHRKRLDGKRVARDSRDRRSQPARLARLRGARVEVQLPPAAAPRIQLREIARIMHARVDDLGAVARRTGLLTQNHTHETALDIEDIELLAGELGVQLALTTAADEDVYLTDRSSVNTAGSPSANIQPRPPVVTVMGHVDHGKTTLLDTLRKSNLAAAEVGGITQSIGAFRVALDNASTPFVTFLDTPGHEAFTAMRARGVHATDIVVLVVAADDGVMPQTVEAANHAIAAATPIIVAITKCDLPGANPPKVRDELFAKTGIHTEQDGGTVQCVNLSAVTGDNLPELVESIGLQAALLDLKSCNSSLGEAICIEAKLDSRLGPVTNIVTRWGTLRVGDHVVSGTVKGRIRALIRSGGERVQSLSPGEPAAILGLKACPEAGGAVIAVESEARAKRIVDLRIRREEGTKAGNSVSTGQMDSDQEDGNVTPVPLIVKADVKGSVDAVVQSIEKVSGLGTPFKVIHAGAGQVTRTDVSLAEASGAVMYTFNTKVPSDLAESIAKAGLVVRQHKLIYKLLEDLPELWAVLRGPKSQELVKGYAAVERIFEIDVGGKLKMQCGGCRVKEGVIGRGHQLRVLRGHEREVVYDGSMDSLRHFKENVREVRKGQECGIGISGFADLLAGDLIEVYEVVATAHAQDALE